MTPSEQHLADVLRYYGMSLQLAGILAAALGIRQVRIEWTKQLGILGAGEHVVAQAVAKIRELGRRLWWRFRKLVGRPSIHPVSAMDAASGLDFVGSADLSLIIPKPPSERPVGTGSPTSSST